MTVTAFDTLKAAKALQAVGFEERQAEVLVGTVGDALQESQVTRADLEQAPRPFITKADLGKALRPFVTKADLAEALRPFATKADLAEALRPFITRKDLDEALNEALRPFVTKQDLNEALRPFVTQEHLEKALAEQWKRFEERLERELRLVATKVDIADLERRMTVRLGIMLAAGIGLAFTVIGLL